jgi:hypothetical protein
MLSVWSEIKENHGRFSCRFFSSWSKLSWSNQHEENRKKECMTCFSSGLNGWKFKLIVEEITSFMDEDLSPQQCKVSTEDLSTSLFQ